MHKVMSHEIHPRLNVFIPDQRRVLVYTRSETCVGVYRIRDVCCWCIPDQRRVLVYTGSETCVGVYRIRDVCWFIPDQRRVLAWSPAPFGAEKETHLKFGLCAMMKSVKVDVNM